MRHGKRNAFACTEAPGQGCACGVSRRSAVTSIAAFAATAIAVPVARTQPLTTPRIVDTHHHFFPPPYLEPLKAWSDKAGLAALWPAQQNWTVAKAIEDMVVFGTDYPYLSAGQNLDGLRKLVTPAQMAAISRDNAVRLLPRLRG